MASNIRIHQPDSCYGWGIEFNYAKNNRLNGPAADFVRICRSKLLNRHPSVWFYQSGWFTPDRGYQFFEYFGPNPAETVFAEAVEISLMLGCEVDFDEDKAIFFSKK